MNLYSGATRTRSSQTEIASSSPSSSSSPNERLAAADQSFATIQSNERRAHDPKDFTDVPKTTDGNAFAARAATATAAAASASYNNIAIYAATGTRVLGTTTTAAASARTIADTHVGRKMSGKTKVI